MSDSDSNISSKIVLAKWTDRFLAWLIDFIIISIFSTTIIFALFGTLNYEEEVFWAEIGSEFSSFQYPKLSIEPPVASCITGDKVL